MPILLSLIVSSLLLISKENKESEPARYICYRAAGPILIDGRLNEPSWKKAPWTEPFLDIEGETKPRPRFKTRAKMLWDENYFYVAAELEEPDVWGTLTKRDTIIYLDNDFEVFIDPDGDGINYYELEINPLNTVFDLLLDKPYNRGGRAIIDWDIEGLKHAVQIEGTLNWPEDIDQGWTVEIAFPWKSLAEFAGEQSVPPEPGDQWRVNFSRVERKRGSAPSECDNWTWSVQGVINMHIPEKWGYVQFSTIVVGTGEDVFIEPH